MSCQTFAINNKATRWGGLDFIGLLARIHSAPRLLGVILGGDAGAEQVAIAVYIVDAIH